MPIRLGKDPNKPRTPVTEENLVRPNSLLRRLRDQVILSEGWTRALIAFFAGAVGALAMPPIGLFPALCVTMSVAVWLLDGCGVAPLRIRLKSAAVAGWFLGFGYFVAGLYWLGAAFLVEADRFAWALPLGVFGLPAALACFTAAGFAVSALIWRPGAGRVFSLTFGLGAAEIARGILFTGFPWNVYGMALGQYPLLAQSASIFGLYGLTALSIALAASPATLVDMDKRPAPLRSPSAVAAGFFAVLIAFGAFRLQQANVSFAPNVRLRIMQPNLQQDAKFRPSAGGEILRRYLELSDRSTSPSTAGLANVTHLIWPESAFPFVLGREPQALAMIGAALGGHTVLLTGAIRVEGENRGADAFNALQVVDGSGQILASADKVHLVPFGEYLPAAGLLRAIGLRQFVALPGGFQPGTARRALEAPGLPPFQPLICYEAIFPGEVTPQRNDGRSRPEFFLNVTNDGWFGLTSGPYQHFAQARLRTVEEGLPLVRAANTGISAIVDPYGRVIESLPLGVAGVLDGQLPKPIAPPIFARHPILSVAIVYALALAAAIVRRRRV
ncbi:MAG: apolipoprotein N-acyltransferase [Hyphomicrobiales bacterium]|nr:apolipoprotein N-acyltransferase [Hyphomicrobiales bacterium]